MHPLYYFQEEDFFLEEENHVFTNQKVHKGLKDFGEKLHYAFISLPCSSQGK